MIQTTKRVEALGESVSIDYENYNNEVEKLNDKLSSSPVWARRFSAQEVTNINNLQNQLNNKIKLYDNVVKPYKSFIRKRKI